MASDAWRAKIWGDKLRVWFMHPGWRPAAFLAQLTATTGFLWYAHRMTFSQQGAGAAALVAGLWLVGWLSERGAASKGSVFSLRPSLQTPARPPE